MPATSVASPVLYATASPMHRATARATGAGHRHLPLTNMRNAEPAPCRFARTGVAPPRPADGNLHAQPQHLAAAVRDAQRSPLLVAPPDTLCRATFDRLIGESGLSLKQLSCEELKDLRQALLAAADADQTLTAGEKSSLIAGLNLEMLQRPRTWNEGSGDLQSLIVSVAGWPQGRALRIVDTDHDAIHLYRPGEPEQCHRGNGPELPPPEDDEIILLRHGNHFSLIRRDQESVIEDVPADGDCFFSCISSALQAEDRATSNLDLRRQLADLIWSSPELLQVASAHDGALAPARPLQPARVDETVDAAPVADLQAHTAGLSSVALECYRTEMASYLAQDVLTSHRLQQFHETLAEVVMTVLCDSISDLPPPQVAAVRSQLDEAFEEYLEQNRTALQAIQSGITRSLKKALSSYVERIEKVLAAGQTPHTELAAVHNRIRVSVEAEFSDNVRAKVGESEPTEGHLAALRASIDSYWRTAVLPAVGQARRGHGEPSMAP